ncbi:PAS/PAC sensor hybrid histidine kinase [Caballeronia hypogeia]|uniref:histidine kinase n=1 Tax=Caballeronia hypogeia TaxID=1777140 RepID=A0A158CUD4_9BURK|nr:ATP-binding protein [Caballeronia hypogeia]SAK85934.1 PAS/PAC sensor hybrid histidine kinase [Caballeronia hypogeia]
MTDWPRGSGEMSRLIRACDWTATSLGPIEEWPYSLRSAVDLILASGHAMQLAWGPEKIVIYNDAYAPMLGDHHPRALGIPFRKAWPDIWQDIEPLVKQVFAGETVRFDDMPLVMTRHGYAEDTWWNFSYSPMRDESGAVAGLLNVTVDATAKHRAEQAERERDVANARLQLNEARFRALVTAGGNSIYRMSPDWRLMFQLDNQTLANTAAPIEDWVEKYIPDEDLPAVRRTIEAAIRTKSLFELEHRVRLAHGGVGWVLSRAVPLLGPDGEITEWFGAGSDITQRIQADQVLREREERQSFLLKLSDALRIEREAHVIGCVTTRLVGEQLGVDRCYIVRLSRDAEKCWAEFEYRRADLPSVEGEYRLRDFPDSVSRMETQSVFYPDVASDPALSDLERQSLLAIRIGAMLVAPLRRGERNYVWALVAATTGPRAWTREELGLLEEAAERTWAAMERAHAEAALHEADRRKDQFLAVLAHELRNGLAPLVYNVQIGNSHPDSVALTKELFARSDGQLRHLVHLVDDLLDVARISTGKIELNLELVKPRDVVNLALDACRPEVERKHHRLTVVDEAGSGLTVRGDRVRLTQVVSNLLSNATKYMDDGGSITVRVARDGEQALIEVSDTGIGIPPAALPHVFELFTQVRDQQAYSAGGLGIGLSLVKQLVEMQGGIVTAASEGAGRGSTFAVRLPVAVVATASELCAAAQSEAASPGRALRVLVVDDRSDGADALTELLRLDGHDAEAVYGGPQALESVRRRRPDVVFLDLAMPGMDGFDVARHLRGDFPAQPPMRIVALTGRGQEADRQQAVAASFDGHLVKPADAEKLRAVLSAARRLLT